MSDPARALAPTSKAVVTRQERCYICKQVMPKVSAAHLRNHGYSVQRYERCFGVRRPIHRSTRSDQSLSKPDQSPQRSAAIAELAERLGHDKVWLDTLTDEVGERMLNGEMRHRLTAMCATMLMHRAQVHAGAMTVMSSALRELTEDWRVTQGGKDGAPTSTEELLRIVEKAGKVVRDSEEAVQRTMKLALDEQRTASEYADGIGPTLYQGKAEKLDLPAGLTPGDRETMRGLLGILGRATAEARTIDVGQVPANIAPSDVQPGVQSGDAQRDELMAPPTPPPGVVPHTTSTHQAGHQLAHQLIEQGITASQEHATLVAPPSSDPLSLIADPIPIQRRTRRRKRGGALPTPPPPATPRDALPDATDPTKGVNDSE